MRNKKGNAMISGFVISLILVGLFATLIGGLIAEVEETYDVQGNQSISNYIDTTGLLQEVDSAKEATKIQQNQNFLDVIGGYFSAGYSALKTTAKSFDLFDSMMVQASEDLPFMQRYNYKGFIVAIIIILLFVGVIAAVLVKMRI